MIDLAVIPPLIAALQSLEGSEETASGKFKPVWVNDTIERFALSAVYI